MAGIRATRGKAILSWVVVLAFALTGRPAQGQEPPGTDPVASAAVLDLRDAPDPVRRKEAAAILATIGSPAAIQALRSALSSDPDPQVREAAAGALGRLGPLARAAIPTLIQALDDTERLGPGDRGRVCSAAAEALGALGRYALDAVEPLARAGNGGCGGDPSAALASLSLLANDLSRTSSSLPSPALQEALDDFRAAEAILGPAFPAGAGQALGEVRREIRSRRLGRFAPALSTVLAAGGATLSLFRHLSGILAALLLIGLVLLGLKNSRRILPKLGIHLPAGEWKMRGHSGLRITPWKLGSGGDASQESRNEGHEGGEDHPGSMEDGEDRPGSMEDVENRPESGKDGEPREGESLPPKGSRINVILADVHARYQPAPGGPSRERVERVLQALAWTLMKEGKLEGWVSLKDFRDPRGEADVDGVLAYLQDPLKVAEWDPGGDRVRLAARDEETAQLGSLHLLKEMRARPQELLAQLGSLHAAPSRGKGRKPKADFLRLVASALLDVADELEEEGPALGIAEEALVALAGPEKVRSRRGGGQEPDRSPGGILPPADARLPRLLKRLESEDHPAVRERIITVIGGLGPEAQRALPVLMRSVERDPPGVALAALDTLGRIGPGAQEAAPILLEALEMGRPSHRLAATRALGRMGAAGEKAAPTLLSWISKEGIPHELRAGAVEALGGMPGQAEAAIPPLMELLRSPVATEVRAAAALALARLDPGRKDVQEALAQARKAQDRAVQGMVAVAFIVRNQRLRGRKGEADSVDPGQWIFPMAVTASVLAVLQLGAVVGSEFLSPGTILPALFVGPVMAFLGGMVYAVITRRLPLNPTLGSGVTGWGGASLGLLLGFLVSAALSPLALVVGGGMALGSGAFGGALVHAAVSEL